MQTSKTSRTLTCSVKFQQQFCTEVLSLDHAILSDIIIA